MSGDAERAAIFHAHEVGRAGRGTIVLVAGEAGIGKTALLSEARAAIEERGMRALHASGVALEREFGYGVVRQLLDREVHALSQAERERVFSGAAAPAAGIFGVPVRRLGDEAESPFVVRHGLVWLLEAMFPDQPLALLVDDLQWVDGASLRWLAHLGGRSEERPIALLCAQRNGEASAAKDALAELRRLAAENLLNPAPLSTAAVGTMAARALGSADEEFIAHCHEATAGNPLLLSELLRAAASEGLAVAHTDSAKGGGLRSTFEVIPDAPISSLDIDLFGGSKGLIISSRNLCSYDPKAKVEFKGHNSKIKDYPRLAIRATGCKRHHKHKQHKRRR